VNKTRRAQLQKVRIALEDQKTELEELSDAELEAWENMPESIQASDRGEAMEAAAELMAEAADDIAHTLDTIYNAHFIADSG